MFDFFEDFIRGLAGEGRMPTKQDIHDYTTRPHITFDVVAAIKHLRSYIKRRARLKMESLIWAH
jgi:hypothetical protein